MTFRPATRSRNSNQVCFLVGMIAMMMIIAGTVVGSDIAIIVRMIAMVMAVITDWVRAGEIMQLWCVVAL